MTTYELKYAAVRFLGPYYSSVRYTKFEAPDDLAAVAYAESVCENIRIVVPQEEAVPVRPQKLTKVIKGSLVVVKTW